MRGLFLVIVAGALLAPATPAFAHGGDTPGATAYRTTVTGISTPEKGLTVRTVVAGTRLELSNTTGHSVEVLGYAGEPYLDVRPDGTWQNVNSPAAYVNGDPTAPPTWRKLSSSTTVRWHDERARGTSPGHWTVPLRVQTRVFEIRGTIDRVPPPRAWLWWGIALLTGLISLAVLRRWVRPVALIGGLTPLTYALSTVLDGASPSLVLVLAGLLAIAAAVRHPPFYLALSGACLALFAGLTQTAVFRAAVLPTAGPAWLTRAAVAVALGAGAAMAVTGALRLRAAAPPTSPDLPTAPTIVVP